MPLELLDLPRAGKNSIGIVTCPNCQVTMQLVTMKPVEGQAKLREASYRCPRCGADTTRWIGP